MPLKLTEKAITAAIKLAVETKQRGEVADETFPGLRLRITAKGKGS